MKYEGKSLYTGKENNVLPGRKSGRLVWAPVISEPGAFLFAVKVHY